MNPALLVVVKFQSTHHRLMCFLFIYLLTAIIWIFGIMVIYTVKMVDHICHPQLVRLNWVLLFFQEFLAAVKSGRTDIRSVLRSSEAGRAVVSTGKNKQKCNNILVLNKTIIRS